MTPLVATPAGPTPMVFALTIGGAICIQVRETSKGSDPRPMSEHRFWIATLLQGDGLGVLTDAIYASESRNGKSCCRHSGTQP